MTALASIFLLTAIVIAGLLFLIQALVRTELQIANERRANKHDVLSKQDEEYAMMKRNVTLLQARIMELEGSRQDLFNYIVKQEKMMEQLRSKGASADLLPLNAPQNDGTPQV